MLVLRSLCPPSIFSTGPDRHLPPRRPTSRQLTRATNHSHPCPNEETVLLLFASGLSCGPRLPSPELLLSVSLVRFFEALDQSSPVSSVNRGRRSPFVPYSSAKYRVPFRSHCPVPLTFSSAWLRVTSKWFITVLRFARVL